VISKCKQDLNAGINRVACIGICAAGCMQQHRNPKKSKYATIEPLLLVRDAAKDYPTKHVSYTICWTCKMSAWMADSIQSLGCDSVGHNLLLWNASTGMKILVLQSVKE